MENPTGTVIYLIDKAIKEYRKLAQKNVRTDIKNITTDQGILLMILDNDLNVTQNELAQLVFKDNASVTRMIELMVKNGYIRRTIDAKDRRKHNLVITGKGKSTLDSLEPIIQKNRKTALTGISSEEIAILDKVLTKIITNCKN